MMTITVRSLSTKGGLYWNIYLLEESHLINETFKYLWIRQVHKSHKMNNALTGMYI